MRNIFFFLRRYSVFLLFFLMQIISLSMLFTYNRFHRAKGMGIAGEVTGFFNTRYNRVEDFFRLSEENRRVQRMNDSLMNLLNRNFSLRDSSVTYTRDSLVKDSSQLMRNFAWSSAEVVFETINSDKNYLQLNKGADQGVTDDMAVFSSNGGYVGKVVAASSNFSEVLPLTNVVAKLSVQLLKNGKDGTLSWDGRSPTAFILSNITRADSVKTGDTVITGRYSQNIPYGKMVGTVSAIAKDPASNFLELKVRPAANFGRLQQVFLVRNVHLPEQKDLHEKTIKLIEGKPVAK